MLYYLNMAKKIEELYIAQILLVVLTSCLVSCGPEPDCLTKQGVFVFLDDNVIQHTCQDFEDATEQFIVEFASYAQAKHYALPDYLVASAIFGLDLFVRNGSYPCEHSKFGCSGFADSSNKTIKLALHPEICKLFPNIHCDLCNPIYSAYYHELSHIVMCISLGICADSDTWLHDTYLMQFEKSEFNSCN